LLIVVKCGGGRGGSSCGRLCGVNQSKVLTKPHTGQGEATSQHHHHGVVCCSCYCQRHLLCCSSCGFVCVIDLFFLFLHASPQLQRHARYRCMCSPGSPRRLGGPRANHTSVSLRATRSSKTRHGGLSIRRLHINHTLPFIYKRKSYSFSFAFTSRLCLCTNQPYGFNPYYLPQAGGTCSCSRRLAPARALPSTTTRGVPTGTPLWDGLVTCRVLFVRGPVLGLCCFVSVIYIQRNRMIRLEMNVRGQCVKLTYIYLYI